MSTEQREFTERILKFLAGAEWIISAHNNKPGDMERIEKSIAARRASFEELFPLRGDVVEPTAP